MVIAAIGSNNGMELYKSSQPLPVVLSRTSATSKFSEDIDSTSCTYHQAFRGHSASATAPHKNSHSLPDSTQRTSKSEDLSDVFSFEDLNIKVEFTCQLSESALPVSPIKESLKRKASLELEDMPISDSEKGGMESDNDTPPFLVDTSDPGKSAQGDDVFSGFYED